MPRIVETGDVIRLINLRDAAIPQYNHEDATIILGVFNSNPAHWVYFYMAEYAKRYVEHMGRDPQRTLFVAVIPWQHLWRAEEMVSKYHRLNMLKLLFADGDQDEIRVKQVHDHYHKETNPFYEVPLLPGYQVLNAFSLTDDAIPFSVYDALMHVRKLYPNVRAIEGIKMVSGSEVLPEFMQWGRAKDMLEMAQLLIFNRPNGKQTDPLRVIFGDDQMVGYHAKGRILPMAHDEAVEYPAISSRALRIRIRAGMPVVGMGTRDLVDNYIRKYSLFR